MGDNPCSVGALKIAFATDLPSVQVVPNPVLQVLQIKPIAAQANAPERFRVVLSDTVHYIQSMISTQSNYLVQTGELVKGCFIQLSNYNAQKYKDKRILIIIDLHVLKHLGITDKIGSPTGLEAVTAGQQSAGPQPESANANQFYGNKPQQLQRTAPVKGDNSDVVAGGAASSTHANTYPIEAISPYQNKWTIKARVTHKSEIKHWTNQKGEGKLFTVHFLDETGEIRATGFNQECDNFYEVLQEGSVYYVSKCRVNMAKKQYSNVNNDYELTFGRDTEIVQCNDDSVPKVNFNFVPLSDLEHIEKDAIIDVLSVVKEVGELDEIVSKSTGKPYSKRDISIVDSSNAWVRCTIWGNNAKSWDIEPDNVVAFKGVKVGDYGGRSLSLLYSSSMMPNPDIDEAHSLKGWYDGQGQRDLSTYQSHQGLATLGGAHGRKDVYKTLAQVRDESLGMSEVPDYFVTKATIVYIKRDNISYPACLNDTCNKKVLMHDNEGWRCEKCDVTHPKPQYRYIMTISVNDAFGQAWLNCFDDVGRLVLGRSADELEELKEKSDDDGKDYEASFSEALCKTFVFRCRAKQDTFEGQTRVRCQVMSATPMDYAIEANKLAEQIKLYSL